jgi:hypothetical protein
MSDDDWDSISREVVSLFNALTENLPLYVICLNWNLVCTNFTDDRGRINWVNDGSSLSSMVEESVIGFVVFSSRGVYELTYYTNKKPNIELMFAAKELSMVKFIKTRHNKFALQLKREKRSFFDFGGPVDSHELKFDPDIWDFIQLRRHFITGKNLVALSAKKKRAVKKKDVKMKVEKKADVGAQVISIPRSKPAEVVSEVLTLDYLVESGTKEEWSKYVGHALKNRIRMDFPPLDASKCKFPDYGYRQLIELIIENKNFLRLIIEIKTISGFRIISLNNLIRGDDSTRRGLEALCNLLIAGEVTYNPVSETDFKYLNIILDAFTIAKRDGINRTWNIELAESKIEISANFDKDNREWQYAVVK